MVFQYSHRLSSLIFFHMDDDNLPLRWHTHFTVWSCLLLKLFCIFNFIHCILQLPNICCILYDFSLSDPVFCSHICLFIILNSMCICLYLTDVFKNDYLNDFSGNLYTSTFFGLIHFNIVMFLLWFFFIYPFFLVLMSHIWWSSYFFGLHEPILFREIVLTAYAYRGAC